ncbi:hypothetical protein DSOUD_2186 [Desulfuromonas soudanensis]|uniref:Uncharacterized protein n=1 Tax=Desulfuromonas soudanensis TaxID=1603606 RepID=A0A0M4D3C5_9BACT|nr:hypothetical protein [Desulfuromonas soudanensis]ALC16951.1 hypothetical protein DSOUD_2186 [Desulfuromonas soudanensis]
MVMLRKLSGAFTGGVLGGLLDSFNIWAMGVVGISDLIGIGMKPEFAAPWLYQRMIWGGLWMLLLVLPVLRQRIALRGMLFSLLPSAMMLFVVLPSMGKGMFGLGFGTLMPVVVVGLNFLYGIVASYWYAKASS